MRRNLIYLAAIIIPALLVIIAYKILIQGEFPWIFLFVLGIISLFGLYTLGPTLFPQTTATGQSQLVKFQLESLKVTPFVLVGLILYDYLAHHTMRWETYTGLVLAQLFLLLIAMLLSHRTG